MTWVEKGVLKNLAYNGAYARRQKKPVTPASINNSLVMEGTNMSIEEMIKTTRRGLLVTFFWYIRGVDNETLLNTGMTRDGLFLIENGEIAGPVQNFRWNMSPIVGYNNLTAVGKSVSDAHRRIVRRRRLRAGAAGADRRLPDDLGFAGGSLRTAQLMRTMNRDFVKTVAMSGMAIAASDTDRRSAGAVAEGEGARVEVQGAVGRRADRSEAARLHVRGHPVHAQHQQRRERHRRQSRCRRSRASAAVDAAAVAAAAAAADAAVAAAAARSAAATPVRAPAAAGRRGLRRPRHPQRRLGFASSPIVTEDEIRRITRMASEVAKASAIAKKVDVRLAPVPAYTDYWVTPMEKDPTKVAQTEKQALVQKVVDLAVANKEVLTVNASVSARTRVEVLRLVRRLLHRAGGLHDDARASP